MSGDPAPGEVREFWTGELRARRTGIGGAMETVFATEQRVWTGERWLSVRANGLGPLSAELRGGKDVENHGDLVGVVMRNSGGSADPEVVRKVLAALRGERVSFVPKPEGDEE